MIHTVLVKGEITSEEIAEILDIRPWRTTNDGLISDAYGVNDMDATEDYFEDDLGLALSSYRFEVWTTADGATAWTQTAFDRLSARTDLDIVWLVDMQRVRAVRPANRAA